MSMKRFYKCGMELGNGGRGFGNYGFERDLRFEEGNEFCWGSGIGKMELMD